MRIKKYSFYLLLIFSGIFLQQRGYTQCTTPISTFPYNEDFEASDGNWVRSSAAHWEWGQIISKPLITVAGGGAKCWLIGGFSGALYNSGSSSLTSPCFNISSLVNPQISFKIFWETERRFDGTTFQYSTDGGTVWQTLGSITSNNGCTAQNWFNYDPIFTLSAPGWSGNMQATSGSCQGGGGSGQWLTARHSLSSIAGATGVIFRFVFAAGTTCNAYDGFAIDDVQIGETQLNSADYSYICGTNNSVAFSSNITGCKSGVVWDFGDIASGANNNSTADNPTHAFSGPGDYFVKLTTNFVSGPASVVTKNIKIIALSAAVTSTVKCNGDHTGAITINVSPSGTYNYAWDTNPVQTTASVSTLGAGTYTVAVSGTNTCAASLPVSLSEPPVLNLATNITDATCGASNGSITTTVTGGTMPYDYTWSTGAVTTSINNLPPNTYSLLIVDANLCAVNTVNLLVKNNASPINISLGKDTSICTADKIILSPGNFASYLWQDNSTSPTYLVTAPGTYSVTVMNNAGCMGFTSINVKAGCKEIYFPSGFTPNGDGRNDGFGPLPMDALSSLKNYKLIVYGRWGEVIFTSTDPFERWNGTYKGKTLPTQAFTWIATYTPDNFLPVFEKGTVSIIR